MSYLKQRPVITVGMGTCGIAAGALDVFEAVKKFIKENQVDVDLVPVGCIGIDDKEVLLDVQMPGEPRVSYKQVVPEMVPRIFKEHIMEGNIVKDWFLGYVQDGEVPYPEMDYYKKQKRRVLRRCGFINPESIDDYIKYGGYKAVAKAIKEMSPEEVIEEICKSGLCGRGGAGFSTGAKWEICRSQHGKKKYVVCNADEGDPGAFMDRSLLEGDPHAVIEGMLIGAYAIGADEGYIYVRAEYPLAVKRIRIAIAKAQKMGFLGDKVLDSQFKFKLNVKEGAGAFVCGEETALLSSIEGKRGMPRPRPPFPAQRGLWGCPTNINNVETWANVPLIIENGSEWYGLLGVGKSKGTKIFAVTGKVKHTGLVEVPMGITLREIIYDIAGGVPDGKRLKAVQIGGPSGSCLPESMLDIPVDYDSLRNAGAIMGSGGMVVLDDSTCMVELARFFAAFSRNESCGKCTPCREGTARMLEILTRITSGKGNIEDLEMLEELCEVMRDTSLCGLGQTAPNPVLSTIKYFRDEYMAHIYDKTCPAGVCAISLQKNKVLLRKNEAYSNISTGRAGEAKSYEHDSQPVNAGGEYEQDKKIIAARKEEEDGTIWMGTL